MKLKQWLACSLFGGFSAVALASLSTAGCGSTNTGELTDSGTDVKGTTDHAAPPDHATTKDGPEDTSAFPDTSMMDGGSEGGSTIPTEGGPSVSPTSVQLLNLEKAGLTGGIQILGLTTDNKYIIYFGSTATTTDVYALPVAGGAAETILAGVPATATMTTSVTISNNTVFVWSGLAVNSTTGDLTTGVGPMSVWTETTKTQSASTASAAGVAAASPDSTKIVFATGVNSTGTLGTLVASTPAAPMTTPTMLLAMTGTSVTSTALFTPQLSFVSDTYFVASHQESGSATITVSSWATTGWAQADLLVGAVPFSTTNPEWATNTGGTTPGSLIAATTSTGQLEVIPVAGPASAAILVDVPGTTSFVMQKSGDGIVYGNSVTGSVSTSTLPTAAPLPIVATGFGGFYTEFGPLGTSPNEGEVLFYKTALAASAGGGVNLYVAPNVTASMATTLLGTTTGAVFGDIFTADSNYVLYVTQLEAASVPNAAVGNLNAWDIAGAKNVVVSGDDNMWDSDALTGSTIIYNDNFLAPMGATIGVADLKTVDVSATTLAPKLIQSEGDMNFFLTSDKLKVIFTITQAGNQTTDGIYYYPL